MKDWLFSRNYGLYSILSEKSWVVGNLSATKKERQLWKMLSSKE
jgi:hypothetical protein